VALPGGKYTIASQIRYDLRQSRLFDTEIALAWRGKTIEPRISYRTQNSQFGFGVTLPRLSPIASWSTPGEPEQTLPAVIQDVDSVHSPSKYRRGARGTCSASAGVFVHVFRDFKRALPAAVVFALHAVPQLRFVPLFLTARKGVSLGRFPLLSGRTAAAL
jgi:hypothetical protein